jgi:hypothetical protein
MASRGIGVGGWLVHDAERFRPSSPGAARAVSGQSLTVRLRCVGKLSDNSERREEPAAADVMATNVLAGEQASQLT